MEFETQKEQNCELDFRQICWALKLKIFKVGGYKAYNNQQVLKEHKWEATDFGVDEEREKYVRVPLVFHVNIFQCWSVH